MKAIERKMNINFAEQIEQLNNNIRQQQQQLRQLQAERWPCRVCGCRGHKQAFRQKRTYNNPYTRKQQSDMYRHHQVAGARAFQGANDQVQMQLAQGVQTQQNEQNAQPHQQQVQATSSAGPAVHHEQQQHAQPHQQQLQATSSAVPGVQQKKQKQH